MVMQSMSTTVMTIIIAITTATVMAIGFQIVDHDVFLPPFPTKFFSLKCNSNIIVKVKYETQVSR